MGEVVKVIELVGSSSSIRWI